MEPIDDYELMDKDPDLWLQLGRETYKNIPSTPEAIKRRTNGELSDIVNNEWYDYDAKILASKELLFRKGEVNCQKDIGVKVNLSQGRR